MPKQSRNLALAALALAALLPLVAWPATPAWGARGEAAMFHEELAQYGN